MNMFPLVVGGVFFSVREASVRRTCRDETFGVAFCIRRISMLFCWMASVRTANCWSVRQWSREHGEQGMGLERNDRFYFHSYLHQGSCYT